MSRQADAHVGEEVPVLDTGVGGHLSLNASSPLATRSSSRAWRHSISPASSCASVTLGEDTGAAAPSSSSLRAELTPCASWRELKIAGRSCACLRNSAPFCRQPRHRTSIGLWLVSGRGTLPRTMGARPRTSRSAAAGLPVTALDNQERPSFDPSPPGQQGPCGRAPVGPASSRASLAGRGAPALVLDHRRVPCPTGDRVNALRDVSAAERASLERVGRPLAVPGGTLRSGSSAVVAMPRTRGRFRTTDQRSNG